MNLGPWGSRVREILDAPPKPISPGEAVSQWVRDNPEPPKQELDVHKVAALVSGWMRPRLRPEGVGRVSTKWVEMSQSWIVSAEFKDANGDTRETDTLIWWEQVMRLSEDLTTWTALLEYTACKLLSSADLISVGHLNAAEDALNDAAEDYNERMLAVEAEKAMESIKRSAAWGS